VSGFFVGFRDFRGGIKEGGAHTVGFPDNEAGTERKKEAS
jgi:hypothetical protein